MQQLLVKPALDKVKLGRVAPLLCQSEMGNHLDGCNERCMKGSGRILGEPRWAGTIRRRPLKVRACHAVQGASFSSGLGVTAKAYA